MTAIQQQAPSYLGVPVREDPMELSSESERRRVTDDDIDIDLDFASDHAPDAEDEAMIEETHFNIVEDIQSDAKSPVRQDDEMLDNDKVDDLVSVDDTFSFRDDALEHLEDAFRDEDSEIYDIAVSAEETRDTLNIQGVNDGPQDEEITGDTNGQIGDDVHHVIADDQTNLEADLEWSDEPIHDITTAKEYSGNTKEPSKVDNVHYDLGTSTQADLSPNALGSGVRTGDTVSNLSAQNSPVAQSFSSTQQHLQNERDESTMVSTAIYETKAAPTSSPYLHPVVVQYSGNEIFLFPPVEQDQGNSETYFLQDESYMDECINELLVAMRSVLADTISEQDELEISIEALGLNICESALESTTATLAQVLDVYLQLQGQDGLENPEPLHVTLNTKPRFSHRMQYLYAAAAEGKGLSQLFEMELHQETTPMIPRGQEEGSVPQNILSQSDASATAPVEENKRHDDNRTDDLNYVNPESGSEPATSTRAPINTRSPIEQFTGDVIQTNHQSCDATPNLTGNEIQEKVAVENHSSAVSSFKDTKHSTLILPKVADQENEDLIDYDTDDDPFDSLSTETSTLRGDAQNSEVYGVRTGSNINSRRGSYEESPNPRALKVLNNSTATDNNLVFDVKEYSPTNDTHAEIGIPQTEPNNNLGNDHFIYHATQSSTDLISKEAEYRQVEAQSPMKGSSGSAAKTADSLHLDVGVASNNDTTSQSLGQHASTVLDTPHLNNLSTDLLGDDQAQADLRSTFNGELFLQNSDGAYETINPYSLNGSVDILEDLEDDFDYNAEEPQPVMAANHDKDAVLQANPAPSSGLTSRNLDEITYDDDHGEQPAMLLPVTNPSSSPTSLKRLRGDDEGTSQGKLPDTKRVRSG